MDGKAHGGPDRRALCEAATIITGAARDEEWRMRAQVFKSAAPAPPDSDARQKSLRTMPRIYTKTIRVEAEAIDMHGHVNNQNYLRWMEEIATEHSAAQGWPMERFIATGASWYVRSHMIEYLRPAKLGDEIDVYTWIGELSERKSPRRFLFVRCGERRHSLVRAETVYSFVHLATGRPTPIRDDVRAAFEIIDSDDEVLRTAGVLG
jgi:acyl-CoA thioester hydrolase